MPRASWPPPGPSQPAPMPPMPRAPSMPPTGYVAQRPADLTPHTASATAEGPTFASPGTNAHGIPSMVEEEDEGDWLEVRRASTPVEADMVRDFLKDHGVRSAINGDSGGTRLPWQHTIMDIRIVVSPRDLDEAREVLAAMVADTSEHPFRGAPPVVREEEAPYVKPRSVMAAMMLGWMVPIGSGHFYARHGAAGTLLCAGIAGSFIGIMLGHPELVVSAAILVATDVAGAYWAVRRFNQGRVPAESVQRKWATGAVLAAFAAAFVVGRV